MILHFKKTPILTSIFTATLLLLMIFSVSSAIATEDVGTQALTRNCSTSSMDCRELWMVTSDDEARTSSHIYAQKGQTIWYYFENNSSSIHQVGYAITDFYGFAFDETAKIAVRGGLREDNFFIAPYSGFYGLGAGCGGNSQTGCSGIGRVWVEIN